MSDVTDLELESGMIFKYDNGGTGELYILVGNAAGEWAALWFTYENCEMVINDETSTWKNEADMRVWIGEDTLLLSNPRAWRDLEAMITTDLLKRDFL